MFGKFFNMFEHKPEEEESNPEHQNEKPEPSPENFYRRGTIEHIQQPEGGRDLSMYERQLLFDRNDLIGKTVLDLGAGPEEKFAKELKELGITTDVISLSPDFSEKKYAEKIRESSPEGRLVAGIGQKLPLKDASFDRIFAFHVDEHLSRDAFLGTVLEMGRVLKNGGWGKIGPTLDISNDWYPYEAIINNKDLMEHLRDYGITVEKEPIPESVMPRCRIKDSFGNAFYEPSFNIVLKKKEER